ncbi:hypothetical protein CLAFUW4_08702 [Fulvia fulva]|uniref:Fungal calcium binding protein domain-containing protein n=1 Tax=Passalora fulva TaxID=5499 RepID=A0A9Q8PH42_PASFU|nr:uncharacterized protein CLAFUR5_08801 [Fulvia fulva]KAK4614126.1 hypothetical protein CLAFUR4_08707 [Fulvia fulva]KAK4615130.1 hypothetical protein CLAFUR0_08703 [Fulvia fulva]UJO22348.1 hypothetical protein CLAFUR5_08801 [Fulvia fulva]WPV20027.1 hypothetical protein CLAFUW4_08702 [Fulvia fulva]WPV34803.1 hypothetical protein CLAFUW7_08702 [Fulvia fulva]
MLFSTITGLFLAAASMAHGAPLAVTDPVDPYSTEAILLFSDCHFKACLEALAPAIGICAAALAQGEFDFINDAACFASAAEKIYSKPVSCDHCY